MSDAALLPAHRGGTTLGSARGWGVDCLTPAQQIGTGNDNSNNCSNPISTAQVFSAAHPTNTAGLPYDTMNGLVAQMLSHVTCAMRFPGPLNMDINEITTNLVPYPRLHFLTASMSPLQSSAHSPSTSGPRAVEKMLSSCFLPTHQFVSLNNTPTASGPRSSSINNNNNSNSSSSRGIYSTTNMSILGNVSDTSATENNSTRHTKMLATGLIARGP
uniref:Tubulin epsilon chain n=1 Tax=Lygus hesperus TaxID=30085 RepID=A0A146L592_LYGHE